MPQIPESGMRGALEVGKRRAYSSVVGRMGMAGGDRARVDQCARQSLRRRSRDESGSIIVMFAIFLPVFILVCAIAIDVGYWWVNAKKAQIAADSCALAAAGDEAFPAPDPGYVLDHCRFGTPARDYVRSNLHLQSDPSKSILHESTTVTTPYKDDRTKVEAIVEIKVNTFFGTFVGVDSVEIVRRAVAEKSIGEGDYAIYSHSPKCPEDPNPALQGESLRFNGENHAINGRVHSNGQFLINNGGSEPFWARIGTNVFCGEKIDPVDSARFFGPTYAESEETLPRPVNEYNEDGVLDYENWPEWWTPDEFGWTSTCTYSGETIEIDSTTLKITGQSDVTLIGGEVPTGTYCATKVFKIDGDNLHGNITVLANELNVGDGNNNNFAPVSGEPTDLIFFVVPNTDSITTNDGGPDGTGTLVCSTDATEKKLEMFNGNNSTWEGKIFNPCGLIQINGNSTSTLEGAIYGYQVHVNGNGFNMIGRGGDLLTKNIALVE
jgi:hypothetical protein